MPIVLIWRSIPHPDCDLIIIAGDISDSVDLTIQWMLDTLSDAERPKVIYVLGNHEYYGPGVGFDGIEAAMDRLAAEAGITVLLNQTVEMAGHRIVGTPLGPTSTPCLMSSLRRVVGTAGTFRG